MKFLLAIVTVFLFSGDGIKIKDAWTRPGAEKMATALYFAIENNSDKPDTLYKVESDIAGKIELHETYEKGDVTGMREVEMIVVPAKSDFELKPASHHVMVMKLKHDIKIGDENSFRLFFKQAGEIDITAKAK